MTHPADATGAVKAAQLSEAQATDPERTSLTEPAVLEEGPATVKSPWRWLWVGGAGLALGVLAFRDPNQSGSYGFCPLHALTGLDCPFCGGLRGVHSLLHGDVGSALDHNLLLPVYLVVLGALLVLAVKQTPAPGAGALSGSLRKWGWALVALTLVFFVVRNLPWFPYLDARLS